MTDNANAREQSGVQPDLVAKVAEELMASSDASGAQLLGEEGLLTQVRVCPTFGTSLCQAAGIREVTNLLNRRR